RNGARVAAGGTRPAVGQTPKDVVWSRGRSELWRYRGPDGPGTGAPLLVVFSLFSKSYILDLRPGNSFVEQLLEAGFDVYLLDWGVPDERDAANRLEDYVDDYLPAAVERVREVSGADEVNVLGYCFGSVLALLHAAHHLDAPLRSLTVMNTPVDLQQLGPMGDVVQRGGLDTGALLDEAGNVPPRTIYAAFKALRPTATVTQYVDLWERLWDDEYVAAHQAMVGWASDHVPLPGGVARELAAMIRDNAIVADRLVVGGDEVHLSDLRVPFLTVLAERDHIVPEASAAPLLDLVGSADKHELRLDAGHVGLLVGRRAARTTIPEIVDFLRRRSGGAEPGPGD
ncbi:MAG: Poly(3-hydroxyalkanoate) synthetase, partial [Marmoricola sp.]|nr:Poly(3-hydroxyalkanoate) synthetase [Marmoricola sp.]